MVSLVFPLALAIGLMLSPEALVLLGNSIGNGGLSFLAVILFASFIHILTAKSYRDAYVQFPGPGSEALCMREALGFLPAIVFPLCSKVLLALSLSTGILATAGFVFNEVFVYWFPNFAFAFLLLASLLAVNLLGQKVLERAQVLFVTTSLLGLLILCVSGLMGFENIPPVEREAQNGLSIRWGFIGMALFIGYDLAGFAKDDKSEPPVNLSKAMVAGIIVAGFVFCLWGLVSYIYVPLDKLADTTIPYTIAARKILGQKGRLLMGLVIIAGTCGAVNALFIGVSRMTLGMVAKGLLPSCFGLVKNRVSFPLIFLPTGIGVMIALGMAGEPVLEIYIRAGILFWLLNYALVHLSIFIIRIRSGHSSQSSFILIHALYEILGFFAFLSGCVVLLWTDRETGCLLQFMLILSAAVSFFALVWKGLHGKKRRLASR